MTKLSVDSGQYDTNDPDLKVRYVKANSLYKIVNTFSERKQIRFDGLEKRAL